MDITTMSPEQVKAEADRRKERRAQGLPLVGGPAWRDTTPAPAMTPEPVRRPSLFVRLPWSVLVPDNAQHAINTKGRLVNTSRYREAKSRAHSLAKKQLEEVIPYQEPVRLVAAVYLPRKAGSPDIANLQKLAHDALQKVAFTSDGWLADVRWYVAGYDVDAPRAEITICPLTP